jgi:hypothetical protein
MLCIVVITLHLAVPCRQCSVCLMLMSNTAASVFLSVMAAPQHVPYNTRHVAHACRVCACLQTQHKEELDIRDNRGGQAGAGGYGGPGQAPAVQMIPTGAQNPNLVVEKHQQQQQHQQQHNGSSIQGFKCYSILIDCLAVTMCMSASHED